MALIIVYVIMVFGMMHQMNYAKPVIIGFIFILNEIFIFINF